MDVALEELKEMNDWYSLDDAALWIMADDAALDLGRTERHE